MIVIQISTLILIVALFLMMTSSTTLLLRGSHAQDSLMEQYNQLKRDLQNESKMMISTEDLSLMKQYCIDHADRAAAGENVINDLAAIGTIPPNLRNLTCTDVSGIQNQLDSQLP